MDIFDEFDKTLRLLINNCNKRGVYLFVRLLTNMQLILLLDIEMYQKKLFKNN